MAFTVADLEAVYGQNVNISNYSEPNSVPSLDDAYQGLLEQRKHNVIPVSEPGTTMSEDDLLINKNLHTAALFNRLNDSYKQKQNTLEEYNAHLKIIQDARFKIDNQMSDLKKVYISNHVDSVNSLDELQDKMTKYFKETNERVAGILTRKIMELEGDLEDMSRKLNALRSLIVTGVNEIVKTEDVQKKMCPVCFDNEVCVALVPCGHTYCKGCSEIDRSRYAKCPQCRASVNARVKIYFSM